MEQLAYGVILVILIVGDAHPFNTYTFIEKTICVGKRHGTQIPNSLDCGSYYVCDRGISELRYCTPGLHYDPKLQVCNWPQDAHCESSIDGGLDEDIKSSENRTTESGIISTTTSEMLSNSSTSFKTTPTAATTPTIAPTQAITTTTTRFTTTNPPSITSTISTTIQTSTAMTPTPATPTRTTSTLTSSTQLPITTKKVPSTPSVAETTVDESGATNQTGYPVDSMDGYDPSNVRCLHNGLYFLPHPTKCEIYFICSNRELHLHSCASGIHWDYKNEKCNFPEFASCYFNEFTSTTTRPTTFLTKRPKPTIIATTTLPTTISSTLKTPQPDLLPDCPSYQSFIPHPHDCRKYYICISGKPIVTSCPDNMYWNAKQLWCGNPAETECNVIPRD